MPIMQSSFLLPLTQAIPYLVEDTYVRGGLRCAATIADRDAIKAGARKVGMLVYCAETNLYYQLGADKVTWSEFVTDFDLDACWRLLDHDFFLGGCQLVRQFEVFPQIYLGRHCE